MEINSVCFLKWACLCFHQIFSVWYLSQSSQELGCHCFFHCNYCYFNILLCFTFFWKIDCSYPEFCVGPGMLECFSCYFSTIFFYLILDGLTSSVCLFLFSCFSLKAVYYCFLFLTQYEAPHRNTVIYWLSSTNLNIG